MQKNFLVVILFVERVWTNAYRMKGLFPFNLFFNTMTFRKIKIADERDFFIYFRKKSFADVEIKTKLFQPQQGL